MHTELLLHKISECVCVLHAQSKNIPVGILGILIFRMCKIIMSHAIVGHAENIHVHVHV